jgi:hypothetical protein
VGNCRSGSSFWALSVKHDWWNCRSFFIISLMGPRGFVGNCLPLSCLIETTTDVDVIPFILSWNQLWNN